MALSPQQDTGTNRTRKPVRWALDPTTELISDDLTRIIKEQQKTIDVSTKEIERLVGLVEQGDEDAQVTLEAELEAAEKERDELDFLIGDAVSAR